LTLKSQIAFGDILSAASYHLPRRNQTADIVAEEALGQHFVFLATGILLDRR
jgi:hypothetical protein